MVRPFTKWAYEVTRLDELPIALQRAFKELTTPPYGPVFLSFPMNLLLEEYAAPPAPSVSKIAPMNAGQSGIDRAAQVLLDSEQPMIVSGDGVGHAGAWEQVTQLAEALGAPIYTEGYSTLWNCPSEHPLFQGPMPNLPTPMRDRFVDADSLLMCGVTSQAPVSRYDEGGPLVPWRLRVVAVDDSPWEVGKNQAVEVGLVGDIKDSLTRLVGAMRSAPVDTAAVQARTETALASATERVRSWGERVVQARKATNISPTLVAAELRDLMPADAVFVDETISNRPPS